jgi:hypothetical protein
MLKFLRSLGTANVFPVLCYLLAAYFLYAFALTVGVPPSRSLDATSASYLALALFLFMLPEAKKVKLGKLFEYEARIKEIKEDVSQFKADTRATLSAYTSLVSAISNAANQTVNVHLPGQGEASEARKDLDTALKTRQERGAIEEQIDQFLKSEDNDLNYALAKLRMRMEKELRRILGMKTDASLPLGGNAKFLSARSLIAQFADKYPTYEGILKSFDYVLRVCNAAIHGQIIPEEYAHEALFMGIKILNELKGINKQEA